MWSSPEAARPWKVLSVVSTRLVCDELYLKSRPDFRKCWWWEKFRYVEPTEAFGNAISDTGHIGFYKEVWIEGKMQVTFLLFGLLWLLFHVFWNCSLLIFIVTRLSSCILDMCEGAKAWNCLPSQVRNLPTLAFKKSIRKAIRSSRRRGGWYWGT